MNKILLGLAALAAVNVLLTAAAGAAAPVKVWEKTITYIPPFGPMDGITVADIDDDGKFEVLAASGRKVYVWRSNGAAYPGFPKEVTTINTYFQCTPAVGDVDGDTDVEILAGTRGFDVSYGGALYAWHHDGTPVAGFPIENKFFLVTPVLEDMDGDGAHEIVACEKLSSGSAIHVFDGAGRERAGWPRQIPGGHRGAPAVGDVDRDGRPEVLVAGVNASARNALFAWNDDGSVLGGFPFEFKYPDSGVDQGAPALADFDRDGRLEIAFGTRSQIPYVSYFYVLRANGKLAPGWPKEVEGVSGTAGAADVDNDGFLEVIGREASNGRVFVWNYDGSYVAGFPVRPGGYGNVALGDIDDDGCLEIVGGTYTKGLWAFNHGGSCVEGFPITPRGLAGMSTNSPALWDLDGDRNLELIMLSRDSPTTDLAYVEVFRLERGGHSVVWPMHNHDQRHTSCYETKLGGIGIVLDYFCARAEGESISVSWATTSEWSHAGFNLYREVKVAETVSVPVKVNAELITGRTPYRYLDRGVESGVEYRYWLEAVELSGTRETYGPVSCLAGGNEKASFALAQNRPNPARGSTTVAFSVPEATEAALTVFDVAGRKVAAHTAQAKAGENELSVDVSALAPGVYTYRLEAGGEVAARRMVVIK